MKILSKGKFFSREHIWFETLGIEEINSLLEQKTGCDEIIVHGNPNFVEGKNTLCERQYSLIHDISLDCENILSLFSKTVRNEINRSQRELTQCVAWESSEVLGNRSIMDQFSEIYRVMYEEKGMPGQHLDIGELLSYAENDALMITAAYIGDKPVVFHSYVYNQTNCRLLHSCSEFRVEDNTNRNAIGRANKHLHWNDIQLFKNKGVIKYDWGGISSLEEPNGIDKFKLSFGGDSISYYNVSITCSIRFKLYRKVQ